MLSGPADGAVPEEEGAGEQLTIKKQLSSFLRQFQKSAVNLPVSPGETL